MEIKTIDAQSKRRYGSPRVHRQLDIRCGKKRVARLMREHGLRARARRRYKATTDSKHRLPGAENVLARQFEARVPEARLQILPTSGRSRGGCIWLCKLMDPSAMDLFSRRIVGWSMRETMERSLVISALEMALGARRPPPGLLHHSDRGS